MKKTLVSAITTALVVGAASTTFAAANPFSDVPADSWAYDAVTKLAQDGVINGYGDGTFRGDNTITRYEMAQIVAKAMAKTDVSASDKATIDKLAAEFADELNNLGVRVDNLEKKVDNVKFTGEARYRYTDHQTDGEAGETANQFLFRLDPVATINEHWTATARLDWFSDLDSDSNANDTNVERAFVTGKYDNMTVKLGKLPFYSAQGLVFDKRISGGLVEFGSDTFKTTVYGGRYDYDGDNADNTSKVTTGDYTAIQFDYKASEKLGLAAGFHSLKSQDLETELGTDTDNIWNLGFKYAFDKNVAVEAGYAASDVDNTQDQDKAYTVQVSYKGATPADKGSFGYYAGYRHLGDLATLAPTWDGASQGEKGVEIGGTYTFDKNIMGTLIYFDGEEIEDGGRDVSKVFANLDFFF